MITRTMISIWAAVFCWLLGMATAVYGTSLEGIAQDVVKSFAEKIDSQRATVQIAPDSFIHVQSGRRLGLSQELYNVFTAALSKANVKVSVQEVGAEPLVVSGDYEIAEKKITITVRLRQMGEVYSSDLVVRTVALQRSDVAETLLADSLGRAAEGLVRKLASQVIIPRATTFQVAQAIPSGENKATMRIGREFQQAIQAAVRSSKRFGIVSLGKDVPITWLRPEYAVDRTKVTLLLKIDKKESRDNYLVQTSLDIEDMDSGLLQVYDDRNMVVCAEVAARERGDVQPGTDRAEMLLQVVTDELLTRYNIDVTRCKEGFSGRKIILRMHRSVKKTDGYAFVSSRLQADVTDQKGRQLGLVNASARISKAADGRDHGALVRKTLEEESMAELASAVLIYQR